MFWQHGLCKVERLGKDEVVCQRQMVKQVEKSERMDQRARTLEKAKDGVYYAFLRQAKACHQLEDDWSNDGGEWLGGGGGRRRGGEEGEK